MSALRKAKTAPKKGSSHLLIKPATNEASGKLDSKPAFTAVDVRAARMTRFSPLRGFSPARLVHMLEAFDAGYLSYAAQTWDAMARRDDILSAVKFKREAAVALRSWGIRSVEEATTDTALEEEADSQARRLKYFWNNIKVTSAFDRNINGGFSKFVEIAMQAQSYRYGAFHIVWRPTAKGLTATLEHVPLWFFENTIGELRLVRNVGQTEGEPLDATNWLVFAGCGCMEPASVGYGFKHLALNDWMSFSERYGMPFPIGETTAALNSPEWQAMEDALDHISNEGSAVIGAGAKIQLLTANGAGEVPMTAIVERMDKAFAVIYRGADLSTISKGNSQGASVQGNESLIIEAMDCGFISEIMQQLERRVLEWYDGDGVEALAYGAIKGPNLRDTKTDLTIDERLTKWGVRLSKRDALERYQREAAAEDEESLESTAPEMKPAAKPEAQTEDDQPDDGVALNFNPYRDALGRFATADQSSPASGIGLSSETEQVRAMYEGTDQWMKAPNGEDSKLSEADWLRVRTPAFKAQHGNWEALAEQQRIDAYIDLVAATRDATSLPELSLRAVTEEEVKFIRDAGGPDVAGMIHTLKPDALKHALRSHSDPAVEAGMNQRVLTVDHLKMIPAVLDAPDSITVQPRGANRSSIIYRKSMDNGEMVYVERSIETSGKRRPRLITKSAWVNVAAGVKSNTAPVYTPGHGSTLLFKNGRVNPATVTVKLDANGEPVLPSISTNEKPAPGVMLSAHDAVMEDLAPILDALKATLKADDSELLTLLQGLDLNALATAVMRGRSLEQELTGILGQTFADAVGLPDLIEQTLAAEQAKDA